MAADDLAGDEDPGEPAPGGPVPQRLRPAERRIEAERHRAMPSSPKTRTPSPVAVDGDRQSPEQEQSRGQ